MEYKIDALYTPLGFNTGSTGRYYFALIKAIYAIRHQIFHRILERR